MNVSGIMGDDLAMFEFLARNDGEPGYEARLTQLGLTRYVAKADCVNRIVSAREHARREALKNLGRYKFLLFGYYAARWVTLNQIIGDRSPNPFSELVVVAKKMLRSA